MSAAPLLLPDGYPGTVVNYKKGSYPGTVRVRISILWTLSL